MYMKKCHDLLCQRSIFMLFFYVDILSVKRLQSFLLISFNLWSYDALMYL